MDFFKNNKRLSMYEHDQLIEVIKPLNKAVFKKKIEKVKSRVRAKPDDRIMCDVCGKEFTRSARSNHNKTQRHQIYLDFDNKLRNFLIG